MDKIPRLKRYVDDGAGFFAGDKRHTVCPELAKFKLGYISNLFKVALIT